MNTQYYIEPQEVNFQPVTTTEARTEIIYLTPQEFALNWMVVAWMRTKWNQAVEEQTLLEVEVQHTPFGRYVLSLNVMNNK